MAARPWSGYEDCTLPRASPRKRSEMLSWLRRRRETAERIDAEADALIGELGVEAYAEARRREYESSGDAIALWWSRVPSPGVTRLPRYYEPLRHPMSARPVPHGRPVDHPCSRIGASRVACAFLVYMLPPLPRCSSWVSSSLFSPNRVSLPRKGSPGRPAHRPFSRSHDVLWVAIDSASK